MSILAIHAPTLLVRTDDATHAIVAEEYARDPENADREFGANPRSIDSTSAFRPEWIARAMRHAGPVTALSPPIGLLDSSAGRGDAFTWCVGQWVRVADHVEYEGEPSNEIPGCDVRTLRMVAGQPVRRPVPPPPPFVVLFGWGAVTGKFRDELPFDDLIDRIARDLRSHGVRRVLGDTYNMYPLISGFMRHRMRYEPQTWDQSTKSEALSRARTWMRDGAIAIEGGDCADTIRRELIKLQVKATAGGGESIGARRGGHDDHAALVLNFAMADALDLIGRGSPVVTRDRRLTALQAEKEI